MAAKTCLVYAICNLLFVFARTEGDFYEGPGVSAEEIIQARGFKTEVVHLTTGDGYRLKLLRAWNPLFDQRDTVPDVAPILFIHGIVEDPNIFVINSFKARPRNFSSLDLFNSSVINRLARDPSSKSLPILAMNFGHEVWLLSRRGAPGSQQKLSKQRKRGPTFWPLEQMAAKSNLFGLPEFESSKMNRRSGRATDEPEPEQEQRPFIEWSALTSALGVLLDQQSLLQLLPFSFDADFWSFSFDEQARHDFPLVLDYINGRSSGDSKVSVVSHSAGGAIVLMALAEQPQLAQKISSSIFWSQGFTLGFNDSFAPLAPLAPILDAYVGSLPPAFSSSLLQAALGAICSTQLLQRTLCDRAADLLLGQSGGNEPMRPEYLSSVLFPTSAREISQNLQCIARGGLMHMYDHGSSEANRLRYNQDEPPAYDLSRIVLDKMSFYVGRTDSVVSAKDVEFSTSKLAG